MAMAKSTMVGVNICRTPAQRCSQQLCGSRMDPDARFSSARSPYSAGPNWAKFLATLGVTGAIAGPLLDGIHSRVHLQVYDSLPVDIVALDLHTSVFVPPLLAVFYMVLGVSILYIRPCGENCNHQATSRVIVVFCGACQLFNS